MLKLNWYLEDPLDFEYKNYILLDYTQKIDESYRGKNLSPYLLWTEKLVFELKQFEISRKIFLNSLEKKKISLVGNQLKEITSKIEEPESIKILIEIVEYANPILESKIKLGYKLLEKYPQILF